MTNEFVEHFYEIELCNQLLFDIFSKCMESWSTEKSSIQTHSMSVHLGQSIYSA